MFKIVVLKFTKFRCEILEILTKTWIVVPNFLQLFLHGNFKIWSSNSLFWKKKLLEPHFFSLLENYVMAEWPALTSWKFVLVFRKQQYVKLLNFQKLTILKKLDVGLIWKIFTKTCTVVPKLLQLFIFSMVTSKFGVCSKKLHFLEKRKRKFKKNIFLRFTLKEIMQQ